MNLDMFLEDENTRKISKYLKLILGLYLIISCFGYLLFILTYAKTYGLIPTLFLSLDSIWIFGLAVLASFALGIFALPFNVVCYYLEYERRNFFNFFSILSLIFIILYILIFSYAWYYNLTEDKEWAGFGFFIVLIYFALIAIITRLYKTKKVQDFYIRCIVIVIALVYLSFFLPEIITRGFYKFFTNFNLAADNIEFYVKEQDKIVTGKLLFKDDKYAYVQFTETRLENGANKKKVILKQVPVENISIIKELTKEQKQ